jgi:hypothetical protein
VPADLPANSSEKARASITRVRLITQANRASFAANTAEGTAESYRLSDKSFIISSFW